MKSRILHTCQELFFKYGVRAVTMDEVATELGISKKTIYQYFENKEDIIIQVAASFCDRHKEYCTQLCADAQDPIDEQIRMIRYNEELINSMNPALAMEVRKYFPAAWDVLSEFDQEFFYELNVSNIKKGKAMGLYRDDADPEILSAIHCANHDNVISIEMPQITDRSLTDITQQYVWHFLHGLCTPKGRALLDEYKTKMRAKA